MGNAEVLINLWREPQTTINHFDKIMDDLRVRIFALFGTITSIAAALCFWAPNMFISNIRLSVIIELTIVLMIIPLIFHNRIYHLWLFRAMGTAFYFANLA